MSSTQNYSAADQARFVRDRLPPQGLFAGQDWRISPTPFYLESNLVRELETLGRVLLQFNRAVNLLYRLSVAGKQPDWIARWLDLGKPGALIELQRSPALKNELPRVIRPDLLLTDSGFSITELDSVPGGIGLTAWLNTTYTQLLSRVPNESFSHSFAQSSASTSSHSTLRPLAGDAKKTQLSGRETSVAPGVVGGSEGMLRGFEGIFGDTQNVHIIVSEESSTYRPEMEWLGQQLGSARFKVRDTRFTGFEPGDAAYRFFELFDLANVENSGLIFDLARDKRLRVTPPPKAIFEEKMLFALLWNRHLRGFWRQELGEGFFRRLLEHVPYTWIVDPAPLPPHGAIPELNLTDWQQLKTLSHRERDLILKVSGFSAHAWGARGVYLGSDLSVEAWSEAVDLALRHFDQSPCVLQRYHKPKTVESAWFDFARGELQSMPGRVRLCPYYFVIGDGDAARAQLGGILATICPVDKKIIHGMKEAILAPCASSPPAS